MTKSKPSFSFIIPTYNGAHKVGKLISSIQDAKFKEDFEIIVVIDGSFDATEKVLEDQLLHNTKAKILLQKNQGRAKTRNNGVQQAAGTHLFLADDDMRISSNSLSLHTAHHLAHPGSILVGKVIMDSLLFTKSFDYYLDSLLKKWEPLSTEKSRVHYPNFKFTTQHVSMPKEIFHALGGFDDRLTDAEDYDFGMRALEAGIPIYYDPTLIAYHDDFPTCSQYIKRQMEYKRSHQQLKQLGKKYAVDLFPPIIAPKNALKRIATRCFSCRYWVMWIDKERFSFLPQKLRFKLYSIVVYSHTLKGLGLI